MPGTTYPTISTANGPLANLKDVIGDLKKSLDNFDISSTTSDIPFSHPITAAFGDLTNAADSMYDNTYIAVAAVLRTFAKLNEKKFDKVKADFFSNVMIQAEESAKDLETIDFIKNGGTNAMMKDNKATDDLKKEVREWFKSLVTNDDVRSLLELDTDVLADVMASAPAKIDKNELKIGGKHGFLERKVVNIGALRMPDTTYPKFMLFSVTISVWTDCARTNELAYEERTCLTGQYHWKVFHPRVSMIESLKEATRKKAESEGKEFYRGK